MRTLRGGHWRGEPRPTPEARPRKIVHERSSAGSVSGKTLLVPMGDSACPLPRPLPTRGRGDAGDFLFVLPSGACKHAPYAAGIGGANPLTGPRCSAGEGALGRRTRYANPPQLCLKRLCCGAGAGGDECDVFVAGKGPDARACVMACGASCKGGRAAEAGFFDEIGHGWSPVLGCVCFRFLRSLLPQSLPWH
jgi:hypothetical protein